MKQNIIILTSGLTGSSILAGLLTRAGYWTGETHKKTDYDTYENKDLIKLNLKLFEEVNYCGNYLLEFPPEVLAKIASLYTKIDTGVYRSFVAACDQHQPWIWKDPRLWLTIRFWKNLVELENCKFLLLTRGLVQSWISSTLRRQITTFRYSRDYEINIQRSLTDFLNENALSYLHLRYEELILSPIKAIDQLNSFLQAGLTVEDLQTVYHRPLFKSPRNSLANHIKAIFIYLKNYSERRDTGARGIAGE